MKDKPRKNPLDLVDAMVFGGLLCGGAGAWMLWGPGWALLGVGSAAALLGAVTELGRALFSAPRPPRKDNS